MIPGLQPMMDFATDVITIYIILLILPFLLRFILHWFYSIIAFIFRMGYTQTTVTTKVTNIVKPNGTRIDSVEERKGNSTSYYKRTKRTGEVARFVSIITLPGTLLRVALMFLYLRLRGWGLTVSYPGLVSTSNRDLSSERRTGFFISMRPNPKRRITLKEIIHMSLIGYIPLILAYIFWTYRADSIDFVIYIQQGNGSIFWIYFWHYYLLFAIIIGGAPIPEETMLPIYFMLAEYAHLIIGIIGAYLVGMLLSMLEIDYLGYSGHRIGYTYFLLFSSILYFRVAINHKQYSSLTKARIEDILLAMDSIELF